MSPATPGASDRPARSTNAPRGRLTIRRILCPTDLTDASDAALEHAAMIAGRFGADLTVYHSIDLRKVARSSGRGTAMADALRRAEIDATRIINGRLSRIAAPGRVRVEYGLVPHQAVAAAIADGRPDLTVMSTHGRRGLAHLVLGSIAETAIEEGGRPVLCVRGRRHSPARPYRRILLPTDLRSRAAFPVASLLAEAFDADVIALHAVSFERASLSGFPREGPFARPTDAEVAAFLEPDFDGLRVSTRVVVGPGWEGIPQAARDAECDLVVMSTHRQDSLADAVLGSRAERVVAAAPCPVIVV
jgi:nucleotide-binding universal stress UspA family protein